MSAFPLSELSSSLNSRSEEPNVMLASKLAAGMDSQSIKILVENLHHKNRSIQGDCIKVLYEVGEINPELIKPYVPDFLECLNSKNNRMVWGGMTALSAVAKVAQSMLKPQLDKILSAGKNGSVIAMDHAVRILVSLCLDDLSDEKPIVLLYELLIKCPDNQFPMYCEQSTEVMKAASALFLPLLENRLGSLPKESQKKRIIKVLKKLG